MDFSRISALLQPYLSTPLSPHQLRQVSLHLELLLRWNQKMNLTAVREPEQIIPRHFGESFFLADCLLHAPEERAPEPAGATGRAGLTASASNAERAPLSGLKRILDIGSGAGFPGLPLKIRTPQTSLVLIESQGKKAAFLAEVIRALALREVRVFRDRAENFPPQSADFVTLRAVEKFADVLPIAARLTRPGGSLALLIGGVQVKAAHRALPSFAWGEAIPVPGSLSRVLMVGRNPHCYDSDL